MSTEPDSPARNEPAQEAPAQRTTVPHPASSGDGRSSTARPRRVLVVVAHPDDETFGLGSAIATCTQADYDVTVCCATRGEAGETLVEPPAGSTLGDVREAELRAAGDVLGVKQIVLLDFADSGMTGDLPPGALAGALLDDVVAAVGQVIEDVQPELVITLDHEYGDHHRDHDMIGSATVAAMRSRPGVPVYLWTVKRSTFDRFLAQLGELRPDSDYVAGDAVGMGRPDDHVTTVVDIAAVRHLRERGAAAHASQPPPWQGMPPEVVEEFLGTDHFVRVQPPWEGGPPETGLP
jgi:LmbE family N-acetylglucosaminyl deacetylase